MSIQSSVDSSWKTNWVKTAKEKILEDKTLKFALWDVKMYTKATIIQAMWKDGEN